MYLKIITFGIKEHRDVEEWIVWANNKCNLPIYLYGTSMGGATVLFTNREKIAPFVKGIIADSAFVNGYDQFTDISKRLFHLPEHPFMDIFRFYFKLFVKEELNQSAIEACKDTRIPVIAFHCKEDRMVSYKQSYPLKNMIYKYILFEGGGHCRCYGLYTNEVQSSLIELWAKMEN